MTAINCVHQSEMERSPMLIDLSKHQGEDDSVESAHFFHSVTFQYLETSYSATYTLLECNHINQ